MKRLILPILCLFFSLLLTACGGGGGSTASSSSSTGSTGNTGTGGSSPSIPTYDMSSISPTFSVTNKLAGVVQVNITTLPGSNPSLGGTPPAWEIRYLQGSTALTESNWSTAILVQDNLAGPVPAAPVSSFDLLLPTNQSNLWVGIRSKDASGNLGSFTALTTPNVSTALTSVTARTVPNANQGGPIVMKVADVDGDGYDDVIAAYPSDNGNDGRIYIWFGSSTGLSASPMVLSGSLPTGTTSLLGTSTSFEVADIEGAGVADIIAGESNCTNAYVDIWSHTAIAAAKAAHTTPTVILLSDSSTLIGGTIRAVGKVTGGTAVGSDLLVSNFTSGCTVPTPLETAILPRGGAWTASGTSNLFSTGSPATTFITLPPPMNFPAIDATYIHSTGGAVDSLVISYLDSGSSHTLMAFSGSAVAPGGTIAWSSGTQLTVPSVVATTDSFGLVIGGGLDAIGDATTDLVVSYPEGNEVFVYDGASIFTAGVGPNSAATLNPNGETGSGVGTCAQLLPDLTGDGKAEYTGCANTGGTTSPIYMAFGFTGSAPPWTTSYFPLWDFLPVRGQQISGSGSVAWGQAVGAGHTSSLTSYDLVVLSHSLTGNDTVQLLH